MTTSQEAGTGARLSKARLVPKAKREVARLVMKTSRLAAAAVLTSFCALSAAHASTELVPMDEGK